MVGGPGIDPGGTAVGTTCTFTSTLAPSGIPFSSNGKLAVGIGAPGSGGPCCRMKSYSINTQHGMETSELGPPRAQISARHLYPQ